MISNNKGVTAVEYGLIGALISVVILGSVALTGTDTKEVFCIVASSMEKAMGGKGESCQGSSAPSIDDGSAFASELSDSTKDNLDLSFIPKSLGGTETGIVPWTPTSYQKGTASELTALNNALASSGDSITYVFGLTATKTGDPITSYEDAVTYLNSNDGSNYISGLVNLATVEAVTAQGAVYKVSHSNYVQQSAK